MTIDPGKNPNETEAADDGAEGREPDNNWRDVFLDSEPGLRAFLGRRLGQHADAEDCLQVVFLKAVEQGQNIPVAARKAWLFRVASNQAARIWRDQSTTTRILEKHAESSAANETPDHLENLVAQETTRKLRQAIDQLPPSWQQVVRLRIHEGMTFQEIANHLQIPLGTALTQMRRALEQLAAKVTRDEDS
ncbi:ECF RNA polymerase sigma factor SigH [Planctomycetes bacterium CA13]|uniref:ECF RNA polymerase sigma factor SigH n=1 Tax=Novipirellula herctigrandis TaxID=2527986 RepID=A0A5C5Z8Q7_9BACT|nr:ECF RNA polymerase sigma factor SigH [Planctomycetes bacterium CA13]